MVKSKTGYQYLVVFLFSLLLQSCALNDKHQLNNIIQSTKTALNGLNTASLTEQDIAAGLKEALKVGAERVVVQLGKRNGYLNDKTIHIVLPENLHRVHTALSKVGLGHYTKELEIKMNRAAEVAATRTKELFWSAIKEMQWQDIQAIYKGKADAATQYFRNKMTPSLKRMMKPVIEQSLSEVGVVKTYNHVINKYHSIPFVPEIKEDLTGYVMNKGIDGLFHYLAKEEAAIRNNPAKRTTALLKRVFAGK